VGQRAYREEREVSLEGGDMTWGDIERAENGGIDEEEEPRGYLTPFDDVEDVPEEAPEPAHDTWRDTEDG
jgi:hypothetical protein